MNRTKNLFNNKGIVILLHGLVWAVLFLFPYLLSGNQVDIYRISESIWIPLILYAFLFYVNYFLLIDHYLFSKKIPVYILVNILLIALLFLVSDWTKSFFPREPRPKDLNLPPEKFFIYLNSISFLIPLIFSISLKTIERWQRTENQRKEAQKIKLESEIQHLKYQLQPHFFFNSLNNIYALVDISPEKAKESIHSLGKLMRYLLYETNVELVPLQMEINFMQTYIEVSEQIKVAPLVFITFIENAFKHGVSSGKTSEINFKIEIDERDITFCSVNDFLPKDKSDKSGSGIGLVNLQKRLDLIYRNEYLLETRRKNDQFIVNLNIPVK